MRKIIIYKDRVTVTQWDEFSKTWTEHDVLKLNVPFTMHFNRLVEIHPDVTVEDFMKHLEKHESVIDYCFADYMQGISLRLFLNEMEKEDVDSGLEDVELFWEGETINHDLAIIGYLRVWLKEEKVKELGNEFDVPHDINFLSLNSWKKCNFILNENLTIVSHGQTHEIKNDVIFEGFYRWTFFEVVSNFLSELTLNGSPEQRDALLAEMENKQYDAKEISKDKDKSQFWMAFLEAEISDLRARKEKILEEEDYERAAQITKDIEGVEKDLVALKEEIEKNEENGKTEN